MAQPIQAGTMAAITEADVTDYQRYIHEIEAYESESEKWEERGKKIIRRFKDERNARNKLGARFNMLWSNVQTLAPAIYNAPPKPNIERRFHDDDDAGRIASDVLERACTYFLSDEDFDSSFKQSVQDRLLPGRGTVWVRYVPHFKYAQVTGEQEVGDDGVEITDDADESPTTQELDYEEIELDYVNWQNFGHNVAPVWADVYLVWRKAFLTRKQLIARFGKEIGSKVPLDYEPRKLDGAKMKEAKNKATIYELWNSEDKEAVWLSKHHPILLDQRPDPLGLKDFFPCPKPIYATLATDSLIPVPDYLEYQDQANELDELTARISSITKSVKVAGVFDSSAQGLQRLLSEGVENTLIPVEKWAMFAEKGGMQGIMQLLPMKEIVETLLALYEAREHVKKDLYEITGIADIIRGQSNPSETATAQNIKSQFATLRLDTSQKDVARFTRDAVRIVAEIIAEHFSLDTIKNISGVKLLTNMEKQQIQMQQQMAQQQPPQPGAPPPPPIDEKTQKLLAEPSWEDVEALIKNQQIRCYKIDIETDSTIKADQDADRQATMEFLTAAGGFIKEAAQIQMPQMQPLLMEMLMMGIRHTKAGREIEGEFEMVMDKLREAADAPPPPQPQEPQDNSLQVKQIETQAEMQKTQATLQDNEKERQLKIALAQMDQQQRDKELMAEAAMQQQKLEAEAVLEEKRTQAAKFDKIFGQTPQDQPMAKSTIRYDQMGNRA